MHTNLEKWLFDQYAKMPLWVRVIVFFLVFFYVLYVSLMPSFIEGDIYFRNGTGSYHPYTNSFIKLRVNGRTYKFGVDEDGCWSIPIIGFIPTSIELRVYVKDNDSYEKVLIGFSDIWANKMSGRNVELEVVDGTVKVQSTASNPAAIFLEKLAYLRKQLFSPIPLYAQELELTPQMQQIQLPSTQKEEIASKLGQIINEVTGTPLDQVNGEFQLSRQSGVSYLDRIVIVSRIQDEYELSIPGEHLQHLTTVTQFTEYLFNRQIVNQFIIEQGLEQRSQYYEMIQQLPPAERPMFEY